MTPGGKRVVLVAAVASNGVIGNGPRIPWRVPGEQASFKELTLGHTLVMGRTTYESIGRPLPGRGTIVLSRDPSWSAEGFESQVLTATSFEEALRRADGLPGEVMVAGGGAVYSAALPQADALVISEIDQEPAGDVHFPSIDESLWERERTETFEGFTRTHWLRRTTSRDVG